MKGVILAGGTGTRLHPMTKLINKHLLPVGNVPMLHFAVQKLSEAGVRDILLIIPKLSSGLFIEYFGSGAEWNVQITYRVQDQAGGIAKALGMAEGFIQSQEKFILLLGDNIYEDSLSGYIASFERQAAGAMVLLKQVNDPHRYGVPELDGTVIKRIEEKPVDPKSDYCVTGIYLYDGSVFDKVCSLEPSKRGELEITDVNNLYAAEGTLKYDVLQGWWTDAGTPASLVEAAARVLRENE